MIKEKDCRGGDEYRALQELAAIFVVQGGFETRPYRSQTVDRSLNRAPT
jgi:hypothetical protein